MSTLGRELFWLAEVAVARALARSLVRRQLAALSPKDD
jgi:hypothetical protein